MDKAIDMDKAVTFHALSAGSTAIMQSGKVLRFGGSIEKQDHGTKVGRGILLTDNDEEISFLRSLCNQPSPQIWEEKKIEVEGVAAVTNDENDPPKKVVDGAIADKETAAADVVEIAARTTNPAVLRAIENASRISAGAAAANGGNTAA